MAWPVMGTKSTAMICLTEISSPYFGHQHEVLIPERASQGKHETAAFLKLFHKRRRDVIHRRGDHDGVEWGRLRPPEIAVTMSRVYIFIIKQLQKVICILIKFLLISIV